MIISTCVYQRSSQRTYTVALRRSARLTYTLHDESLWLMSGHGRLGSLTEELALTSRFQVDIHTLCNMACHRFASSDWTCFSPLCRAMLIRQQSKARRATARFVVRNRRPDDTAEPDERNHTKPNRAESRGMFLFIYRKRGSSEVRAWRGLPVVVVVAL